jgi:hypothetical protein
VLAVAVGLAVVAGLTAVYCCGLAVVAGLTAVYCCGLAVVAGLTAVYCCVPGGGIEPTPWLICKGLNGCGWYGNEGVCIPEGDICPGVCAEAAAAKAKTATAITVNRIAILFTMHLLFRVDMPF